MPKTVIYILVVAFSIGFTSCKKEEKSAVEGIKLGNKAPDFTLPDVNGCHISLSDYEGKLVLIEFWASWCPYCQTENPVLVMLYNAYKNKGFKILGVSLDTDKNKWIDGIENENLGYDHVSDLKGFDSPVANMYSVSGIPHMCLVDENGMIILITNNAFDVATMVEQHY
ncbi:MAG: TlpA family protein disulfide reductase [Bacteroidetes bacterium]|nr:TlpA family protein disulfide reductase [Bacteroidota bacterium]